MTPVHIRFAGYQPRRSVHSRAAVTFGRELRRLLGKSVRFDLQYDVTETGHQAADLLDMVEDGVVTMAYFSTSYLAERVPQFALLDLPFTIRDRQLAHATLDGSAGRRLSDLLSASSGFRVLGYWDNGFRHITNRVRPIRAPEDCEGLRIRTLASRMHARVFEALGFEPVAIDVTALASAVASGAVDAQENPLTNTYNFGIHKFHRHITLSGHFFGAAAMLCHDASYRSWPDRVRHSVHQAAATATAVQRRLAAAADGHVLSKLAPAQNSIVRLSQQERARFAAKVAPIVNEQRGLFGDMLAGDSGPDEFAGRGDQPAEP